MIESYILIIGAMKSGTTTLFDALARHSAICPCRPKEPGFFAFEEHWAQGFEWYENLFDFNPEHHLYGLDGSTDYMKFPFCAGVPERLTASGPRRFKLICILRHPLRRMEAHARHVQATRREVGRNPSPRRDHSLDAGISPVALEISHYADQLDRYRDMFGKKELLAVTLEELNSNFDRVMRRILDFLELDHEAAALEPIRSNSHSDKRRQTWLSQRIRYGRLGARLPDQMRKRLIRLASEKMEISGRFKLTPAEEERLLGLLRDDLRRLREYGIDAHRAWGIPLD